MPEFKDLKKAIHDTTNYITGPFPHMTSGASSVLTPVTKPVEAVGYVVKNTVVSAVAGAVAGADLVYNNLIMPVREKISSGIDYVNNKASKFRSYSDYHSVTGETWATQFQDESSKLAAGIITFPLQAVSYVGAAAAAAAAATVVTGAAVGATLGAAAYGAGTSTWDSLPNKNLRKFLTGQGRDGFEHNDTTGIASIDTHVHLDLEHEAEGNQKNTDYSSRRIDLIQKVYDSKVLLDTSTKELTDLTRQEEIAQLSLDRGTKLINIRKKAAEEKLNEAKKLLTTYNHKLFLASPEHIQAKKDTASLPGLIASYHDKLTELQKKVTDLTPSISKAKSDLDTIKKNVDDSVGAMKTLDNSIPWENLSSTELKKHLDKEKAYLVELNKTHGWLAEAQTYKANNNHTGILNDIYQTEECWWGGGDIKEKEGFVTPWGAVYNQSLDGSIHISLPREFYWADPLSYGSIFYEANEEDLLLKDTATLAALIMKDQVDAAATPPIPPLTIKMHLTRPGTIEENQKYIDAMCRGCLLAGFEKTNITITLNGQDLRAVPNDKGIKEDRLTRHLDTACSFIVNNNLTNDRYAEARTNENNSAASSSSSSSVGGGGGGP